MDKCGRKCVMGSFTPGPSWLLVLLDVPVSSYSFCLQGEKEHEKQIVTTIPGLQESPQTHQLKTFEPILHLRIDKTRMAALLPTHRSSLSNISTNSFFLTWSDACRPLHCFFRAAVATPLSQNRSTNPRLSIRTSLLAFTN